MDPTQPTSEPAGEPQTPVQVPQTITPPQPVAQTPPPTQPIPVQPKKSSLLIMAVAILLTAIFALGAYLIYNRFLNQQKAQGQPTSSSTPLETPTASPEATPVVSSPAPNSVVKSPLIVTGMVPPGWMFEGTFPILLIDLNKANIASASAKETVPGSWQSGQSSAFSATLTFSAQASGSGTLVLQNANPSGDPAKLKTFEVPILFNLPATTSPSATPAY